MNEKKFNLIIIYPGLRYEPYAINIIKALSNKYKIGLYIVENKKRELVKNTENLYLDKCKELGAVILNEGDKCSCDLMLVRQPYYREQFLPHIKHIIAKKVILTQWWSQRASFVQTMKVGVKEMWLYSRKDFNKAIKQHKQDNLINNIRLIDIEYPYKKFPAFDFADLEIDYLIALPSSIFYRDYLYLSQFYVNVKRLIKCIPKSQSIYFKQHNVSDKGNKLSRPLFKVKLPFAFEFILSFMIMIIKKILRREAKWSDALHDYKIKRVRRYIEKRAIPLSDVTEYHNVNIEHFLPFVKEGVITGISTCIYHALDNILPVYNCDSQPINKDLPNYDIVKDHFIPSCEGELKFDPRYFDLVKSNVKKDDMIDLIRQELDYS